MMNFLMTLTSTSSPLLSATPSERNGDINANNGQNLITGSGNNQQSSGNIVNNPNSAQTPGKHDSGSKVVSGTTDLGSGGSGVPGGFGGDANNVNTVGRNLNPVTNIGNNDSPSVVNTGDPKTVAGPNANPNPNVVKVVNDVTVDMMSPNPNPNTNDVDLPGWYLEQLRSRYVVPQDPEARRQYFQQLKELFAREGLPDSAYNTLVSELLAQTARSASSRVISNVMAEPQAPPSIPSDPVLRRAFLASLQSESRG
jgi:hypothetical protein